MQTQGDVADDWLDAYDAELTGAEAGTSGPPGRWRDYVAPAVDAVVVVIAAVFTLAQLNPGLIITDTTPAGGDMGAHVWGPAYLRDQLLPNLRLTGWAPDWYNGFPAYHFYMVVPALLIVAVNTGWQGWLAAGTILGTVSGLAAFWLRRPQSRLRPRWLMFAGPAALILFGIGLPYGIAFKVVSVAGIVALPPAAYAFGRLARLPFPTPALLAVATVGFLFNREPLINNTGNIIGGNIASTLAGEYSFSLSLVFAILYLGFLLRGLEDGRWRALAAVTLALTALCHLIPAIFVAVATVVAVFMYRPTAARVRWLATTLPVGLLLSAFWVLPFWVKRDFLNDMGWGTVPADGSDQGVWDYLLPKPLLVIAILAFVGAVLSIVFLVRAGILLAITGSLFAAAFAAWPDGLRLWNARLLPFWMLCLFLLAGIGVGEVGRAAATLFARDPDKPPLGALAGTAGAGLAVMLLVVALPLGIVPLQDERDDGSYRWLWTTVSADDKQVVDDWSRWNYSGYERKPAYPEYYELMTTMGRIGEENGCGRAFWEYEADRLNRYGTPMAPMLLPYWTDGCIGSQEGLYFESSATVPYHFITQGKLSAKCSCSQRFDTNYDVQESPYRGFDIETGIQQLQLLGVRYYMAFSDTAVQAADAHDDLTPLETTSHGWHIYEIADAPVVEPLAFEPAVVEDVGRHKEWIQLAVGWYGELESPDVLLAADGPDQWARIGRGDQPVSRPVEPVEVSAVEMGQDRISFDVSQPGTPVLVKTSYFPNWQASGADGPYRVAPNLMVVVPTATHVELTYGWTGVDITAYLLTLAGLVLVVLVARSRPAPM